MNLNPYQNDLLSFYLEKSAGRIARIVPAGNDNYRVTGNPKLGIRRGLPPPSVNPNRAAGTPKPPVRDTGLASGDGPYPLAIR